MDINTDTTPALHAGSAVRANPLHTEYTVHSTFSTLHYKSGGKTTKKNKKQIKTENNNNNKHKNKKNLSRYLPLKTQPPKKKEKKMNTHPRNKSKVKHAQSDYICFSLHYCTM